MYEYVYYLYIWLYEYVVQYMGLAVCQLGIFKQEAPSFMEEYASILIKSKDQLKYLDIHQVAPPLMGVFVLTVWPFGCTEVHQCSAVSIRVLMLFQKVFYVLRSMYKQRAGSCN